jgi:hypothetical protein
VRIREVLTPPVHQNVNEWPPAETRRTRFPRDHTGKSGVDARVSLSGGTTLGVNSTELDTGTVTVDTGIKSADGTAKFDSLNGPVLRWHAFVDGEVDLEDFDTDEKIEIRYQTVTALVLVLDHHQERRWCSTVGRRRPTPRA